MAITQQQIALEAKVSRSTVAAVMSKLQRDRISPEVRDRVMAAAEKLGYRPNRHAQIMRRAQSHCIGILNFNAMRPLAQRKLKAMTEAILAYGYQWMVEETLWYRPLGGDACAKAVDNLLDHRVEGVLLNYADETMTQELLERILQAGIPVAAIAADYLKGIPDIVSDRVWGYETMTRYLLEGGYRKLVTIAPDTMNARYGFQRALKDYPEAERQARVILPLSTHREALHKAPPDSAYYLPGYLGMEEIIQSGELPEAIVCTNDEWALGALSACSQHGLSVPRDLALTGFDNDPAARFGAVPITTMDHPTKEIAQTAVDRLMGMIQNGKMPVEEKVLIRGKLLVRDSCGLRLRTQV